MGQLSELHGRLLRLKLDASAALSDAAHESARHGGTSRAESVKLAAATEHLWRVLDALHGKANFDPNQPRVPRGNSDGGQWTDGVAGSGASRSRLTRELPGDEHIWPELPIRSRDGHHYGPQSFLRKLGVPSETMKIFADAKTGPVLGSVNQWSALHKAYNIAVEADFWDFVEEEKIDPKKMTPDQARRFVRRIIASRKPPIREFNLRVLISNMMQMLIRRKR